MPDKRTHRGAHPADAKLFASENIPDLRAAVGDYSLLLTKGYSDKSALKLVGDRFSLTQRQRLAVMRIACSDQQLNTRMQKQVDISALHGEELAIDGYNLLITIEAAMSGGLILKGRDRTFRDLASLHGTYRKVDETVPALELIGSFLQSFEPGQVLWLLDSPVSNSGRLKTLIGRLSGQNNWQWQVKLTISPDHELVNTDLIVVSSDSVVLDGCKKWVNLARIIIEKTQPNANLIDLSIDN
jgi:hypothetical protein